MLGEFEYLLITAAAGLGENAYGAAIGEEIETTTGRRCSIGALYTTIDRLETKGLLKTWMGEATPLRRGFPHPRFEQTFRFEAVAGRIERSNGASACGGRLNLFPNRSTI